MAKLKRNYQRLGHAEKLAIANIIATYARIAGNRKHFLRDLANREIRQLIWRWTADGVDKNGGLVIRDAYKYDFNVHLSTKKARAVRKGYKGLRHEHAVPRSALAGRIIEKKMGAKQIVRLLDKYCHVVIVTEEEDGNIEPRAAMPEGWSFEKGGIYARYENSFHPDWREKIGAAIHPR